MRKTLTILTIVLFILFMVGCENSVNPIQPQTQNDNSGTSLAKKDADETNNGCVTIQSGLLVASDGSIIETGYDVYGYNYQGHMFNGYYGNASRPAVPVNEGTKLLMKWNDAWLSNKDCDGDGKLDRYYGFDSYIGSGAWQTNHMFGEYEGEDGKICKWNYFAKFIAVPEDAILIANGGTNGWGDVVDMWFTADMEEIGEEIWGAFAITLEVYNDPCGGYHGQIYKGVRAGFGGW